MVLLFFFFFMKIITCHHGVVNNIHGDTELRNYGKTKQQIYGIKAALSEEIRI